jgi:hypothetical protein
VGRLADWLNADIKPDGNDPAIGATHGRPSPCPPTDKRERIHCARAIGGRFFSSVIGAQPRRRQEPVVELIDVSDAQRRQLVFGAKLAFRAPRLQTAANRRDAPASQGPLGTPQREAARRH